MVPGPLLRDNPRPGASGTRAECGILATMAPLYRNPAALLMLASLGLVVAHGFAYGASR